MQAQTGKLILILIVAAGFALGCSTEKNTAVTRSFHNLTAHYNVYFNGKVSLEEGLRDIREDLDDDYASLLPVFKSSREEAGGMVSGKMDKAIKKSVKLIKSHSIKVPPKKPKYSLLEKFGLAGPAIQEKQEAFRERSEYCNWVDDAYLLMGKAHFLKHDFNGAVSALKILERNHKYTNLKTENSLWMARAYSEMGNLESAKIYLDKASAREEGFGRKQKRLYHLVWADYYLKQQKYDQAIPQLEQAKETFRLKRKKARYNYILAQIYQEQGNSDMAIAYFGKVIDQNPEYEMAFNAKINRAVAYQGGSSGEIIKKELLEMTGDEKNKEYLDRIYYALAQMEKNAGNRQMAIDYFRKAAAHSSASSNQQALVYLSLGDLYFAGRQYQTSAAYYDSTMNVLSKDYPDYEQVYNKAIHLTQLAQHIQVVEHQDSLQQVASMPEAKRMALIEDIIEDVKKREKEEEAKLKPGASSNYSQFDQELGRNESNLPGQPGGSKFYFYNQNQVGRGMVEFEKKWGKRKLEDNWRRQNKRSTQMAAFGSEEAAEDSAELGDNKTPEYYLEQLPLTDSAIHASDQQIMEAMFNAGKIYQDDIEDLNKARKMYKNLIDRFPESDYKLEAYYQLYQIEKYEKNNPAANSYKNKIIREYPKSRYAKILSDPDYLKRLNAQRDEVNQLYENAYNAYQKGNITQAQSLVQEGLTDYSESHLTAKFSLLEALVLAEYGQEDKYKTGLQQIITDFPNSPESEEAKARLNRLEAYKEELAEQQREIYSDAPRAAHLFFLVFLPEKVDVNQLRFDLLSFHLDEFEQADFKIEIKDFLDEKKSLRVKPLRDKAQAESYLQKLKAGQDKYLKTVDKPSLFLITQENLNVLKENKDLQRYLKFFDANYTSDIQ